MSNKTKTFPKLYGITSMGKIKEWGIRVDSEGDVGVIHTEHGLQNGKKQIEDVMIFKGKNIGRANETTPFEQAVSDAQSKWNGKKDKGYAESISEIPQDILPMLAKRYRDAATGRLLKKLGFDRKGMRFL